MLVGFTTTCAISAYHQLSCEFKPHSWHCVLDTTLCDKVRFVPDQHAELDFIVLGSLKQQSVDRHVTPLGHIILILSQPVFALSP
jgi:hypothetical protein